MDGQLAVSRAFGDKNLKSHLRSDPDITNADIDADTDFLILASDGLWKVKPPSSRVFFQFYFDFVFIAHDPTFLLPPLHFLRTHL